MTFCCQIITQSGRDLVCSEDRPIKDGSVLKFDPRFGKGKKIIGHGRNNTHMSLDNFKKQGQSEMASSILLIFQAKVQ